MATKGQRPAERREMNSELEYSQASNSIPPDMRSKISRGESMLMKFKSTPSTDTAPVASGRARSYSPQANVGGTLDIASLPRASAQPPFRLSLMISVELRHGG